jgi:hypothetical protein
MKLFPPAESRKLTGMLIGIAALLLLFIVYVIVSIFVTDLNAVVVGSITSAITAITGAHQTAQAASDRSPTYAANPPPSLQPPGSPVGPHVP